MASTTLDNLMRFEPESHNIKFTLTPGAGTCTITPYTYGGVVHQADSPALLRFEDLSTLDYYSTISPLTIDAGDTFGLPDDFNSLTPIYVGIINNSGTPLVCASLADTLGSATSVTTANQSYHTLSTDAITGLVS